MSVLDNNIEDKIITIGDQYEVLVSVDPDITNSYGMGNFKGALFPETIINTHRLRNEIAWGIINEVSGACIDKVWRYQRFALLKKIIERRLSSMYGVTFKCTSRSPICGYWCFWDKIRVEALWQNNMIASIELNRKYTTDIPF